MRHTPFLSVRIAFFILFHTISTCVVIAQINISPVRVLLTSRQRDIEVEISNPLDEAMEVTSQFNFKPLRSDSLGNRRLDSAVSPSDMGYSCEKWLRLFPPRFTIPPRGIRSIRIVIIPPDTIPEGEYWARLELTSERVGLPSPTAADTNALVLDLKMKMRMGIPVIFRKGKVKTSIEITGVQARRMDSGMVLLVDTKRLGNAAYRGTMKATVHPPDSGRVIESEEEFTNEQEIRSVIPLPNLPPGTYNLQLESRSARKGSIKDVVLTVPPVRSSYDLRISPTDITVVKTE